MPQLGVRNFHLPLPDETYRCLKEEASRSNIPATALARLVIAKWLHEKQRAARHEEIAKFASMHAGTELDLDGDLELASLTHLIATDKGDR